MILMFVVVSVFCLLALLLSLSYHRFRQSPDDHYFPWLQSRMPAVIKTPWIQRLKEICRSWFIPRYPVNQRWIYLGLAISYGYLVLSGFVFAFFRVRLSGVFLLLHVVLGAVFAVCLCLAVFLRARYYVWHEADGKEANLKTGAGRRKVWQIVLFWIFGACGFVIAVTALCQMLPAFSLRAQLVFLEVHRFAALGILLAGIAFWYFSLVDEDR